MLAESGADNWVEQPYAPFYDRVHYYQDDQLTSLPTEDYYLLRFLDPDDDRATSTAISEDGKPFLAWLGYQAVHYPHQAPKEFIDKYDGVYDDGFRGAAGLAPGQAEGNGSRSPPEIDAGRRISLKTSYAPWQMPDWDSAVRRGEGR